MDWTKFQLIIVFLLDILKPLWWLEKAVNPSVDKLIKSVGVNVDFTHCICQSGGLDFDREVCSVEVLWPYDHKSNEDLDGWIQEFNPSVLP